MAVREAVRPRPAVVTPSAPVARGHRTSVLVLGGLLLGAAVVGVLGLQSGSAAPTQESALARVVADAATGAGWVVDPVWAGRPPGAVLQLVGWVGGAGALDRHAGDAVAAVRELGVLALLVTTALTWLLARRLGASRTVAASGVVVLVVAPLGLLLHRTASAEALAVPWLVAACCLAVGPVGRRPGNRSTVAAGVCAAAATLTAPAVLLLLPIPGWLLLRQRAGGEGRRHLLLAFGTCAVLLGGYGVLVGLARSAGTVSGPLSGAGFDLTGPAGATAVVLGWSTDPVLLVLAAAAALLLSVRRPSARPLASGVAGGLVLAAVPGLLSPTALVLVLPWVALVLPAALLELALGHGRTVRRLARVAPAAVVAATLAATGLPSGAPAEAAADPVAAAEPITSVAIPDPGLQARRDVGVQLTRNPALQLADGVAAVLAAGAVDPRALVVLPRAAVAGLLVVAAVQDTDGTGLVESVLVSAAAGSPVGLNSPLARFASAQPAPFTAVVAVVPGGLLLTWPGPPPTDLLGPP